MARDNRAEYGATVCSLACLVLPVIATSTYPILDFVADLPYGYREVVGPMFYGACVALAAMALEVSWLRRIVSALVVAAASVLGSHTFDVIFILGTAVLTGLIAAPIIPTHDSDNALLRAIPQLLYRIGRALLAFVVAILALVTTDFLLGHTGRDPAGGGDITLAFGRFTFITYSYVVSVIVCDYLAVVGR